MSPDENPAILLNPADSVAVALRSLKGFDTVLKAISALLRERQAMSDAELMLTKLRHWLES